MGKRDGFKKNDRRGNNREQQDLTSRPFKDALRDAKPWGPECLKCNEPIDTRMGVGGNVTKGSRRPARHGYLHAECEEIEAKKYYEESWEQKEVGNGKARRVVYLKVVKTNQRLEVPVYLQTEIDAMMAGSSE